MGDGARHRAIRVAALGTGLEAMAARVAADLREALGVEAEVVAYHGGDQEREARRRLAERALPREWDILILNHGAQAADAPPFELHRAFVGEAGELRAGPVVPGFETLYADLVGTTSKTEQARISYRIDGLVRDEALALFLCAPQALYAVNRHVDFTPYRTTFELAECRVGGEHWSRR